MKSTITLALAILLTACGGGGGSSAPVTAAPAPSVCKPVRIQLFGDSTQWGWDSATKERAILNPTFALQQAMDQRFGYGKVTVENRAVEATTSQMLIDGTDRMNKPWPQSVDADIVVINHGINDYFFKTPMERYKANLRAFTKAPAIVVFETHLPPFHDQSDYDDAMRQVAAELHMPLIDSGAYFYSIPNWEQYDPDLVHPTSEGYALIVRNAKMPILTSIIANMKCGK